MTLWVDLIGIRRKQMKKMKIVKKIKFKLMNKISHR